MSDSRRSSEGGAEPRLAQLEALTLRCLDGLAGEDPGCVERACQEHPELADDLRRSLQVLDQVGLLREVGAESHGQLPSST